MVCAALVLGACEDRARTTAAPEPGGDACEAGCRAMASCQIATTTCVADCRRDPAIRRCTERARAERCRAAATCGFEVTCGAVPAGAGSCATAMACQLRCAAGDLACGCRCVPALAPVHTLLLLKLDVCAINCAYDTACMRLHCAPVGQLCMGL